jgi:PmbA protein
VRIAELKRAAEAALALLAAEPGIREAEVFAAANRSLVTRLNYTSHIPCNGVEEPKSTEMSGLGLQVVFESGASKVMSIGYGTVR